jgi:hypothetical protein
MSIPKPRRAGQVGGGGRIGQTSNRGLSSSRGGRPHAGGGGTGKTPGGKGCAVVAVAMLFVPLLAFMGLVELARALV